MPDGDPRFARVEGDLGANARAVKQHPPAAAEAAKAQQAAEPPADDKEAQAKAAHAEKMATAKLGGFDRTGFVAAVKRAIAQGPEEPGRG